MKHEFVALDGEGYTNSEGIHIYSLLAASDGTYIQNYDIGLSTSECLDFILKVQINNPTKILVGFFTSYDINMIIKNVDVSSLAHIWSGKIWTFRDNNMNCYRISYIPNRLFTISKGWWYFSTKTGKRLWHSESKQVKFWDSSQFFQTSFVSTLSLWNVASKEEIATIAEMKDQRGTFNPDQVDDIRTYCFHECKLLVDIMDKVDAALNKVEISLTSWYGAGSIASAMMNKYDVKKYIPETHPEEIPIMDCYYGGRIETFGIGLINENCYSYDIRSAYPYAMTLLPNGIGTWKYVKRYKEVPYAVWHVKWENCRISPFPYRYKKRIYWPMNGEGWYHSPEVNAAIRCFSKGKIKIIEGWIFTPDDNTKPFSWIQDIYKERAILKELKDPAEIILKLGMNSGYGKLAQGVGFKDEKPPFQNYYWAGYITSSCRAQIIELLNLVAYEDILAIATDAIFLRCKLENLDLSNKLGNLEESKIEKGLLLIQPGVYVTPSSKVYKTRGFAKKSVGYKDLYEAWINQGLGAKIRIPETRFIGLGYMLATRNYAIWRTWQPIVKEITFDGTSTKFPDLRDDFKGDFVRLTSPPAPSTALSEGYIKRKRRDYDDIMKYITDEQPDATDNPFSWEEE